jgi:lipoprotein signal peptidase
VTTTQGWLLIGVPALLAGIVLYTMRSPRLGAIGLLVVTAGALALATVDRASGVALGAVVALLYAAGRAGGGAAAGNDPVRGEQRSSAPD